MNKTEFTPGPYNAVIEDRPMSWDTEATTHLLAAAPEMYALLDMIQTFLTVSGDENTRIAFLTQIKKVLAKARGEE